MNALRLTQVEGDHFVDSRLLAEGMEVNHRSTFRLVKRFQPALEDFGTVRFEITSCSHKTGASQEKFALLNEDQSYFVLTLSKNSAKVVRFKQSLIKEFGKLRRAAERRAELDWQKERKNAALEYLGMAETLQFVREEEGKDTKPHHYMNEAKLINWAFSGKYGGLNRENLNETDLKLIRKLETRNRIMLARGQNREARKQVLHDFAQSQHVELLGCAL